MDPDEPAMTAPSIIDVANGGTCKVYLADGYDYHEYTVYIFDTMGYFIKELKFESSKTEWDGKDLKNEVVMSGVYIIKVIGPKINKSMKVMVIK